MIDTMTLIAGYMPICVFVATLFTSAYIVSHRSAQERVRAVAYIH